MMIRGKLLNGETVEIGVAAGRITSLEQVAGDAQDLLLPGFIELQLNGYKGIDFNNPETTPAQI
ncbi:MAG: hypothetical protein RIR86_1677, partial [Acidobacteriota bacterium]